MNKEELLERRNYLKMDQTKLTIVSNDSLQFKGRALNLSIEYTSLIETYIQKEIDKIDKELGI
jgi:hypothetical protein